MSAIRLCQNCAHAFENHRDLACGIPGCSCNFWKGPSSKFEYVPEPDPDRPTPTILAELQLAVSSLNDQVRAQREELDKLKSQAHEQRVAVDRLAGNLRVTRQRLLAASDHQCDERRRCAKCGMPVRLTETKPLRIGSEIWAARVCNECSGSHEPEPRRV